MSWLSRTFDKIGDELKRGWDRTRKETKRAGRWIDREFSNAWRTAKSTYGKVRREMQRSPYARYAAVLATVIVPPAAPLIRIVSAPLPDFAAKTFDYLIDPVSEWVSYEGRQTAVSEDVAPALKSLGKKAGRFIGKNVDYETLATTAITGAALVFTGGMGSPFLHTLGKMAVQTMADLWVADYYTAGALSEGYTSTFYDDEVEPEDPLVWNYDPINLYPWYPGSYEWQESLTGGDMFNPTDIIEPWEYMNGNQSNTDYTGYLLSNFYDGENPAAPNLNFPGNGFMELYGD